MKQLGFLKRLVSGQRDLEKTFVEKLLAGDIQDSIELGRMLFPRNPMFLMTSLLLDFLGSPEDEAKKNLLLQSLKNSTIKSNLIWMLYKRGLLIKEMDHYVQRIVFKDFLYYLTLKEAYIHGHPKLLGKETDLECMAFLLDHLDDWDLYQHALNNNIELPRRESLNYEYYLLHRFKEKDKAIELLRSRICFKEIEFISGMVGLENHPDGTIDCLIQLARKGFDEEVLRRAYEIYTKNKSVLNTKMIIAVLISSRKASYLGLALYLSFKHRKDFPENYEIFLIFVFLCRYFCFYPHVLKCLDLMNVRNAQVPNLSFIWSDILFAKGIEDNWKRKEAIDNIQECVNDLNKSIKYFISVGNLAHVVDAIDLARSLKESVILLELKERKIIGTNASNSFHSLLGTRCSYLFEKMTVEKIPKGKCMFLTDFYVSEGCSLEDVKNNGLWNVEEDFIIFFREMEEYWKTINK
ncbi:uncharacterized protein Eint_030850 [Encephalitozoon intestinalis ATCC 50506]|uniref:Uncharacterized protein n=1 Tax=Encephalitozoon intestinalis (strain ATCC 50506) TaxID=876142 RepID=E0S694_ENCIT|nr:uncharacterized protein Eint_030850 [Encephalitozoon intestinalis ATCC 50506]ADM11229.1 hypothetical protein Eint_030850 [Encephalitozoon intestinalis ATCC 50506]UTX44897.1 hypothetical protein GPK93_03g04240 [Encephalitozoon intestinalis]